jgi:hypothetical protein
MHVSLWEWEAYPLSIERLFHVLLHVKEGIPIMLTFAERASVQVDRVIPQFTNDNTLRRVIQNVRTFFSNL